MLRSLHSKLMKFEGTGEKEIKIDIINGFDYAFDFNVTKIAQ